MIKLLETNLRTIVKLFVQANSLLEGEPSHNYLTHQDIMELIDVFEEEVHKQLHTTVVTFYNGTEKVITGYNRYKKDSHHEIFWLSALKTVQEINNVLFMRYVTLSGKQKTSVPLMVKRFNNIINVKCINIFKQFTPKEVEFALLSEKNPFDWLRKEFSEAEPNRHPDNIKVARKLLIKLSQ